MTINRAENGPRLDVRFLHPAPQRSDRARRRILPKGNDDLPPFCLLIRFRSAQIDDKSILAERDVGDLNCRELRPAKRAREASQDQRTIARTRKALRTVRNNLANVPKYL